MLDPATPCSWQSCGRHRVDREAIGTTLLRHLNSCGINLETGRAYQVGDRRECQPFAFNRTPHWHGVFAQSRDRLRNESNAVVAQQGLGLGSTIPF